METTRDDFWEVVGLRTEVGHAAQGVRESVYEGLKAGEGTRTGP